MISIMKFSYDDGSEQLLLYREKLVGEIFYRDILEYLPFVKKTIIKILITNVFASCVFREKSFDVTVFDLDNNIESYINLPESYINELVLNNRCDFQSGSYIQNIKL